MAAAHAYRAAKALAALLSLPLSDLSHLNHPANVPENFFLYASALQGREHYGVGTTRARKCAERAGRTVRGTMKLVRRP